MKTLGANLRVLAILGALITAACGGAEEAEEADMASDAEVADPAPAHEIFERPDTTLEAVWSHLQEADYQNNWELWPGKDEFYSGTDPHGMLLTTYVNPAAHQAIEMTQGEMPVGAIVVKENYMPDSTLAATTVMYKTQDFNPDHNNWWFLKRNADGSVDAAGRGQGCEDCHGNMADNDYIFTSQLGEAEGEMGGEGGGQP